MCHIIREVAYVTYLHSHKTTTNMLWKHWKMSNWGRVLLIALAGLASASPALADQEMSYFPHVVAGSSGRCYAKSVPKHNINPAGRPRQQGRTEVYRVGHSKDVLVQQLEWFSQTLFVRCRPRSEIVVVRVGPWHRGHNPRADHLAIAFYRGGRLIRRYSTLDIAGDEMAQEDGISRYKNVSVSISHYSVFESWPELTTISEKVGAIFKKDWVIKATTIDGRVLVFDMATGDFR